MSAEMNRRGFLKTMAGLGAAVGIGETLVPIGGDLNKLVTQVTGLQGGKAVEEVNPQEFSNDDYKRALDYSASDEYLFEMVWHGPPEEELMYRALPSFALSVVEEGGELTKPIKDVIVGTSGLSMTRRELIAGAITSVTFGLAHNFTKEGFSTKNIPASQTLVGVACWYLQRKFGIGAAIVAHSVHNNRIVQSLRDLQRSFRK